MLILNRKPGEKISIGEEIVLAVVDISGGRVQPGIDAPKALRTCKQKHLPPEPPGAGGKLLEEQ